MPRLSAPKKHGFHTVDHSGVSVLTAATELYGGPAAGDYIYYMTVQEPYCTVEYLDQNYHYRVYDHQGSLMCFTQSRSVAQQFLDMANLGISARMYYFLEYYNWKIPRRFLDRL